TWSPTTSATGTTTACTAPTSSTTATAATASSLMRSSATAASSSGTAGGRSCSATSRRRRPAAARRSPPARAAAAGGAKVFSTVTFLRGTLNFEDLLRKACEASNQLTWEVNAADEKAKNRFVIHHVPARKEQEEEWDTGANGLPWYRQKYYRLLSHTP